MKQTNVSAEEAWNNKKLLLLIFSLAWPTVVEQGLQTIVLYVDTAMVGRLGAQASAAVGLTSSMTWLINGPTFALGVGVMAYIARNNGARDYSKLKTASVQAIYLALIAGALFAAFSLAISPKLPIWLGGAKEIQADASVYFAIVEGACLFRAVDIILGCTLRGIGDTKTPMKINAFMNLCNIVLNFLLIYDTRTINAGSFAIKIPGAGLGVAGAAWGTALSLVIGAALMLVVVCKNPLLSPFGEKKRIDRHVMYQCIRVGVPLAAQRCAVFLGHVVFTSLVAGLGTVLLAAHSIAITAEEMFYIPGFGMSDAGATLIGNAMGEGNEQKMDRLAHLLILVTVAMMAVTGMLLFLFPEFMMKLFTSDKEVIKAGVVALRIVALSEPIYGGLLMLEGIFNGVGNTKTTFIVGVATVWGVRVLSTLVCVKALHLGLAAVWCCMVAENVVKAIILGFLYLKGNWKKGAVQYDV